MSERGGRGRGGGGGRGRGGGRGDFSLPSHPRGGRGGFSDRGGGGGRGGFGGRGRGGGGRGGGEPIIFRHGDNEPVPPPNDRVAKIETATEASLKEAKVKAGAKLAASMPLRPGYGTQGRAILLWTNYMELVAKGDLPLYRYDIDITGDREPKGKKRKRIIEILLEENFAQYGRDIATDYKSNAISKTKLELNPNGYTVQYRAEEDDEADEGAPRFRVRLQQTGTLTVSELVSYLTSTQANVLLESKEQMIQALNIVVGHHPKANRGITSVGANKHFNLAATGSESFSLGAGLQAIRGYFVSVRAAAARILVNVQVKHGAFYSAGPLERLIEAYTKENGPNPFKLANFLNKVTVIVTHILRKNKAGQPVYRYKTITNLASKGDGSGLEHPPIVPAMGAGAKDVQFWLDATPQGGKGKKGKKAAAAAPAKGASQGRYISVYDFFKQTYNITIRDPKTSVVNVGSRQFPSYLPAQVCEVVPGQPSNAKLTPSQTQQMIKNAVRKPAFNAKSIVTAGAQVLGVDPTNPTLNAFGIGITPRLLTVPGRVLNCPSIMYSGNKTVSPRAGSWNMMQQARFSVAAALPSWTWLWIATPGTANQWKDPSALTSKLEEFHKKLTQLGMKAAPCSPGRRIMVDQSNAEAAIDATIRDLASQANRPKLLLVIIPPNNAVIRNRVKYACDVKEGLLNVCVIGAKFAVANDQYMANVALKVNLKAGGTNQTLEPAKLGLLAEGKTMVVGMDVTHPSPGSASNAPSVVGIVASVDERFGQWPADLRIQTARREMIEQLDELMQRRLKLWASRNKGAYPENILVYRDGVSEGQYQLVLDNELPALRKACSALYPAAQQKRNLPRISIVVVGKRHNTRFFPSRAEDADRSMNPPNGTVVDRGVTEQRNWDFFLQAHTALQGTARPAHYYVVHDEIFRARGAAASDALEQLTHNLCYLFGRATKAVSICPPAYYADLVCERARLYLAGVFDPTPGASVEGSVVSGEGGGGVVGEGEVRIHERVRDGMFYT